MVNGEVYGPEFDPLFHKHGIRQMIYTSTQGEERFFPDYFSLPNSRRLHPEEAGAVAFEDGIPKNLHSTVAHTDRHYRRVRSRLGGRGPASGNILARLCHHHCRGLAAEPHVPRRNPPPLSISFFTAMAPPT